LIEPSRNRGVSFSREREKFWKALLERTLHAFRIPNEMADSKRSEIFADVPSGETGDGAVAFVLPNPLSNSKRVRIGDMDRFRAKSGSGEREKKQFAGKEKPGVMLS